MGSCLCFSPSSKIEVRHLLYDYIQHEGRAKESSYVFTTQRNMNLTENGIYHWFCTLNRYLELINWIAHIWYSYIKQ